MKVVSSPDEPAGTVGKVNGSTEERKNITNHPVENLDPKADQNRN